MAHPPSTCAELRPLIGAYLDGELGGADLAAVFEALKSCPDCREAMTAQVVQSHALRQAVLAEDFELEAPAPKSIPPARRVRDRGLGWLGAWGLPAASGAALASLVFILVGLAPMDETAAIERHVAGLARGLDIAASDQHQVKPWFAGKIDVAPPVRNLDEQGFVLVGGRIENFASGRGAAIIYRRRQHMITLLVEPARDFLSITPPGHWRGFNLRTWQADGLRLTLVGDVNATDLDELERLLRAPS